MASGLIDFFDIHAQVTLQNVNVQTSKVCLTRWNSRSQKLSKQTGGCVVCAPPVSRASVSEAGTPTLFFVCVYIFFKKKENTEVPCQHAFFVGTRAGYQCSILPCALSVTDACPVPRVPFYCSLTQKPSNLKQKVLKNASLRLEGKNPFYGYLLTFP